MKCNVRSDLEVSRVSVETLSSTGSNPDFALSLNVESSNLAEEPIESVGVSIVSKMSKDSVELAAWIKTTKRQWCNVEYRVFIYLEQRTEQCQNKF